MNVEQQPTRKERLTHETAKEKSPGWRALLIVTAVLAAVSLILAAFGAYRSYFPMQEAAQRGTSLAAQVQEACASASTSPQKDQLGNLCDTADEVVKEAPPEASPEAGPSGPPGETGQTGRTGEHGPAPTAAQIRAAVVSYCSEPGNCEGPEVTQAQVAAAVSTYCSARDECVGPAGEPGESVTGPPGPTGSPGASGESITGPPGPRGSQGPAPSQEAIRAAVTSYCQESPDNCTSEITCATGEPTQLEVRIRTSDITDRWRTIYTCA